MYEPHLSDFSSVHYIDNVHAALNCKGSILSESTYCDEASVPSTRLCQDSISSADATTYCDEASVPSTRLCQDSSSSADATTLMICNIPCRLSQQQVGFSCACRVRRGQGSIVQLLRPMPKSELHATKSRWSVCSVPPRRLRASVGQTWWLHRDAGNKYLPLAARDMSSEEILQ